jgi:hypothetical protein
MGVITLSPEAQLEVQSQQTVSPLPISHLPTPHLPTLAVLLVLEGMTTLKLKQTLKKWLKKIH